MSSKFKASGVLTSGVDYFCLVCECRLHDEDVAIAHIKKPVHTKKFDATEYFGNKDNFVRKINKWYFCELCSLLLPTAARVRLHVSEPQHLENTRARILQRRGTCVVAFSCVQIEDKAWHGIIDETCVICNMEFDEQNIHINETNHIIKLIQRKTEFDSDKNIFRKVDESSIQCITCNMIVGVNSIDIHFKDTEHRNLYQCCCDAYETTIKNSASEKIKVLQSNKNNDKYKSNEGKTSKIYKSSNKVDVKNMTMDSAQIDDKEICKMMEVNDYVITNSEGKLWCTLCSEELNCDIEGHINDFYHQTLFELHKEQLEDLNAKNNIIAATEHAKGEEGTTHEDIGSKVLGEEDSSINNTALYTKPVKSDHKVQDVEEDKLDPNEDKVSCDVKDDIETYIKQNYMTRHSNNNNVYCTECNSNIPYSLRSLKEHVIGAGHQRKMNDKKEKVALVETTSKQSIEAKLIKVKVNTFIKNFHVSEGSDIDIIINDNICIAYNSMLLLINIGVKLKCLICNSEIHRSQYKRHIKTNGHDAYLDECLVVISKEHNDEFIREIRPGHFHCGYCNTQRDSWEALESHLQSQEHKEHKMSSAWRLKEIYAQIYMQNIQREGNTEAMFRMMFHQLFRVENNQ